MTEFTLFLAGMALALFLIALRERKLSFMGQSPEDFATLTPAFDLRRHLSGPLLCEGMIYGPTGRVASRFVADMEGVWQGNQGVLKERFRYDSGSVQDREWRLALGNDGAIRASADDVVGTGLGQVRGAGVVLKYRIRLAAEAGGHELDVTDWMVLMENGTIMNRSQFRKFGIKVAELVATMRPHPAGEVRL
jgi:hypothetical protein